MTELAVPTTNASTNVSLTLFVEEARMVYDIAKALSTTSFVPVSMKDKPQEITGAILFGRELGMDPMTALQTINVIQGRPTLTANAMRGLAVAAGVRFRLDEANETRCVMSAVPPGTTDWTTVTWTLDQARKLDLLKKDNWKNQPGAMLIARATSQLCRLVAANILIGAPYSTEEVRDLPPPDDAPPPKPKLHAVKRQPLPPAEYDEPEIVPDNERPVYATQPNRAIEDVGYSLLDDEKRTRPEGPVERHDPVSTKTRAAIMAAFNEAGVKDRNIRNETVSKILGREVHTVNNITEAEGQSILGVLALDPEWPAVGGAGK